MFYLIFWSVFFAAASGLITKFCLKRSERSEEITWKKFAIGMAIVCFVLAPAATKIGWEVSKSNLITFNEYWNGWELLAVSQDTTCERDGSCSHHYDCDPYIVMVPYSCDCDSKGNCSTCFRPETRYHACPYVDIETDFFVQTTLGNFTIAENRFPDNPQAHRWRRSKGIPSYVIENAGTGKPPFWVKAKARVESGRPGPASIRKAYVNYILASDRTIFKQYSAEIEKFNSAGLLPKINSGIRDFYLADKAYLVGYRPQNVNDWQSKLAYLNASFGAELQGDLHLILVQNDAISRNPDVYVLALKAYWQNTKVFGRDALSKNGTVVILGTEDGVTVSWSRAFTGMPLGNEYLCVYLRDNLKGLRLAPEIVIGGGGGNFYAERGSVKVRGIHGKGALESALWGSDDPSTKFRRYSMSGKSGDGSGFLYLKGEIQPTDGQKRWILFFTFLASVVVWLVCALVGKQDYERGWY